jgi:outer membrane lipoprotein-sorting protein
MKRWLPTACVAATIAAATALAAPLSAAASANGNASPEQLIELAEHTVQQPFSGVVKQTSDLGLPDLGGLSTGAAAGASSTGAVGVLELLTASHTARIFSGGPSKQRIQVMDRLAERDLVRNGREVWLYDSTSNTAHELTLSTADHSDAASASNPAALARRFLSETDTTTRITVADDEQVAGRIAHVLRLTPRASDTLIGAVSVAIDSRTGVPLRLTISAKGQKPPAFQVGFTSFSTDAPPASLFDFTPPADAKVTHDTFSGPGTSRSVKSHKPAIVGSGWDAVVELPAGTAVNHAADRQLLGQLTKPVAGGRAITTSVFSVFISDDGHVLAGSVPVSRLQDVASHP